MDLSLDEIIKQKKTQRKTRGGRGRGRGAMRGGSRGTQRSRPMRAKGPAISASWKHDLYSTLTSSSVNLIGGSAKLHISNLDFGVTDGDMQELFKEFGAIKKAAVHYDRSGRSLGTAEVIFGSASSAKRARDTYNGVPLDGRQMKIDIVGERPVVAGPKIVRPGPQRRSPIKPRGGRPPMRRGAMAAARARRGRGAGARGGRRGGKGAPRPDVSKDQLDKELMDYNSQRS